ncbi:alpha/beta fold hydrolase [Lentzea cavernae]|uniref:Alpha/beta hydrolase n=1 Tax=Lentzea cavernae TaxID=2020703 RepID=A0ABQ3MX74_9PSEU|nr:alpha/beta hydrolase [Lentzea cavernae]GHH63845.1 alpha/beta hydrolase [Lentzea cavernae]
MTTFAIAHGGGDVGWSWHLVANALQAKGHTAVAPDLPIEDENKDLTDWASALIDALPSTEDDIVVVGHSFGGFTAPLAAERLNASALVLVTAMIPAPGEPPADWWANTGYEDPGLEDVYYHDVPPHLAAEAEKRSRGMSENAMAKPWPLAKMPDVPTHFILCTEDRFFTPTFMRKVVADRLDDIKPVELAAGHYAPLSKPNELATLLATYAR